MGRTPPVLTGDINSSTSKKHLLLLQEEGIESFLGDRTPDHIPSTVWDAYIIWVNRRVMCWAENKADLSWEGEDYPLATAWATLEEALCDPYMFYPGYEHKIPAPQRAQKITALVEKVDGLLGLLTPYPAQCFFEWPWEKPLKASIRTKAHAFLRLCLGWVRDRLTILTHPPDLKRKRDNIIHFARSFLHYILLGNPKTTHPWTEEDRWLTESLIEVYSALLLTGAMGLYTLRSGQLEEGWDFPQNVDVRWDKDGLLQGAQMTSLVGCIDDYTDVSAIKRHTPAVFHFRGSEAPPQLQQIVHPLVRSYWKDILGSEDVPIPDQMVFVRDGDHYLPYPNLCGALERDWEMAHKDRLWTCELFYDFYLDSQPDFFSWESIDPEAIHQRRKRAVEKDTHNSERGTT